MQFVDVFRTSGGSLTVVVPDDDPAPVRPPGWCNGCQMRGSVTVYGAVEGGADTTLPTCPLCGRSGPDDTGTDPT